MYFEHQNLPRSCIQSEARVAAGRRMREICPGCGPARSTPLKHSAQFSIRRACVRFPAEQWPPPHTPQKGENEYTCVTQPKASFNSNMLLERGVANESFFVEGGGEGQVESTLNSKFWLGCGGKIPTPTQLVKFRLWFSAENMVAFCRKLPQFLCSACRCSKNKSTSYVCGGTQFCWGGVCTILAKYGHFFLFRSMLYFAFGM